MDGIEDKQMKNILLIVDMQDGFVSCRQTKEVKKRIIDLLDRKIFDVVIATRFLNEKDSIYERLFDWKQLEQEDERVIAKDIMKHVDFVVDKYVYDCVNASFIQRLCQLNDGKYPEKVFVVGVDTDCCVLTIATSLYENNIRPVVLTQYIASNGGKKFNQAGLLCMERLIGKKQLSDIIPQNSEDINKI